MQKVHQSKSPVQLTNRSALLHERFPTKPGRIRTHVIDRWHPIGQQWCEKCDACALTGSLPTQTTKVEVRQAAKALVTLLSNSVPEKFILVPGKALKWTQKCSAA